MSTYKEQIENKYSFVLVDNGKILATFGNLRKVTNYMKDKRIEDFPSYWTIIRRKGFPIDYGQYQIAKVRHV